VWDRYGVRAGKRPVQGLHPHEVVEEGMANSGESGEHVTPKYVPFWRRLLVKKRLTTTPLPSTTTTTPAPTTTRQAQISDSMEELEEEWEHQLLISKPAVVNNEVTDDWEERPKSIE